MPAPLTNADKTEILAGELLTTPGICVEAERNALVVAKGVIRSVLDELDPVTVLTLPRKEYAAQVMGQYTFDAACAEGQSLLDNQGLLFVRSAGDANG